MNINDGAMMRQVPGCRRGGHIQEEGSPSEGVKEDTVMYKRK